MSPPAALLPHPKLGGPEFGVPPERSWGSATGTGGGRGGRLGATAGQQRQRQEEEEEECLVLVFFSPLPFFFFFSLLLSYFFSLAFFFFSLPSPGPCRSLPERLVQRFALKGVFLVLPDCRRAGAVLALHLVLFKNRGVE